MLELNATSVQVGYLFENPRLEDNHASEAVVTKQQLGSVLRLLCFVTPPLPAGDEYWDNRNTIVQWHKVSPVAGDVDSIRYWADDRAKTAISFSQITFDTLGTYSCTYGGLSRTIDVVGKLQLIHFYPHPCFLCFSCCSDWVHAMSFQLLVFSSQLKSVLYNIRYILNTE